MALEAGAGCSEYVEQAMFAIHVYEATSLQDTTTPAVLVCFALDA